MSLLEAIFGRQMIKYMLTKFNDDADGVSDFFREILQSLIHFQSFLQSFESDSLLADSSLRQHRLSLLSLRLNQWYPQRRPSMRRNIMGCRSKFAQMARAFEEMVEGVSELVGAEIAVRFAERLSDDLRVPRRLRDVGIPDDVSGRLAEAAVKVTRLLANNPRKMTLEDANAIYKSAY